MDYDTMSLLNKLLKKNVKINQEVEEPPQFRERIETEYILLGGPAIHSNQIYAVPRKYNASIYKTDEGEDETYNSAIEEKLNFVKKQRYNDLGTLILKEEGLPLRTMYNIYGVHSGSGTIVDILFEPKTKQAIENNEKPSGSIYAIYYNSLKPIPNSWDKYSIKFFFTMPEQKKELLEYQSIFNSEEIVSIKEVGTFKNIEQNLTKESPELNYAKIIHGDYYSEDPSKKTQPQIIFQCPGWIDSEISYVNDMSAKEENSQRIIKTMSKEYKQEIIDSFLLTLIKHSNFKSDPLKYHTIKNILKSSF